MLIRTLEYFYEKTITEQASIVMENILNCINKNRMERGGKDFYLEVSPMITKVLYTFTSRNSEKMLEKVEGKNLVGFINGFQVFQIDNAEHDFVRVCNSEGRFGVVFIKK